MKRRHLLRAPEIRDAVVAILPDRPSPTDDLSLVRVSRRAMATTFEIAIPFGTPNAIAAAEAALDLIDELEDQLTIYCETSEIARINATAFEGSVLAEPKLFALFSHAAVLTAETAGAFDLAAGAIVKTWGFHKREGRIPDAKALREAREASGTKHVILNEGRIKFRRRGLELNLGGIGKGYALDRAAELLRNEWGIRSALLHAGGSSVYALGSPPNRTGWTVALKHPWKPDETLGTVALADRGLGTSAATFQFFEYNGKKYGHVLDPRSGHPAEGTANANALAPTAAEADALSTAFFVLGTPAVTAYCQSRPEIAAVMLADFANAQPAYIGLSPTSAIRT